MVYRRQIHYFCDSIQIKNSRPLNNLTPVYHCISLFSNQADQSRRDLLLNNLPLHLSTLIVKAETIRSTSTK
ncbi:hypothetical protein E2P81_ATG07283 [Venturia nashicola]|uniref:Uncharacterized protein n=1 Tax=Venturia nashicola TaxID=86259 RepID=A0A4Z1P1E4_9PEZI|nr:hypothetical protein E6O75_ATG07443 [Venturia nashicola]TLD31793.1 hypothetical protein E2P81_ATG07283 [Venturia nashicola]